MILLTRGLATEAARANSNVRTWVANFIVMLILHGAWLRCILQSGHRLFYQSVNKERRSTQRYPRIQILTIEGILDFRETPRIPTPDSAAFKKAPKEKQGGQGRLDL